MLAKGQPGIRRPPRDEISELQLGTQGRTLSHLLGLSVLRFANRPRGRCNLLRPRERHEEHTVLVTHYHIVGSDQPAPHASRKQRIGFPFISAERTGWEPAEAKHRKADLNEIRCIPV